MNLFDKIQDTAFGIVTNTFGYPARWNSREGAQYSAKVLYKDATESQGLSDEDFEIERYKMEYNEKDFPRLKEIVEDSRSTEEVVIVFTNVERTFQVKRVTRKFDGKTMIAFLNPVE